MPQETNTDRWVREVGPITAQVWFQDGLWRASVLRLAEDGGPAYVILVGHFTSMAEARAVCEECLTVVDLSSAAGALYAQSVRIEPKEL